MAMIEGNSLIGLSTQFNSEVEKAIWEAAEKYGVDYQEMYDLAWCESRLNIEAKGDSGKAYGLYQWHLDSWKSYAGLFQKESGTYLQRGLWQDQVEMTAWVISRGETENWRNCYLKI